jgi:hypothetical protein
MKIIIEFKNKFEHDKYCLDFSKNLLDNPAHIDVGTGLAIEDNTRRKHWSEMEIQFVKDNYAFKKVRWIAKQLRRKSTAVSQMLTRLYAAGLPKKKPKNGEIYES